MEQCIIRGTIRRRRDLSRHLSFFTLDIKTDNIATNLKATDETYTNDEFSAYLSLSTSSSSVQLVCDGWSSPRCIVAGMQVCVKGFWEESDKLSKSMRFLVPENGFLDETADCTSAITSSISAGYSIAAEHALWRARTGATCTCTDLLCPRAHGNSQRWETRRQLLAQNRAEKKALLAAVGQGLLNDDDCSHKISCASKSKHNIIFVSWLIDTFPASIFTKGVVDIAAGRGLIALELSLSFDVSPVTVIEPKPIKLNTTYRRKIKRWRKRLASDVNKSDISADEQEEIKKIQCIKQHEEEFYGLDGASPEARSAIEQCGLVVAMHPDAATVSVLETAIQLKKPFAIVPCCVFSYKFQDRLTPEGKVVSTYEELLDYLNATAIAMSQGHCTLKRAQLPFEGRNIVLYSTNWNNLT